MNGHKILIFFSWNDAASLLATPQFLGGTLSCHAPYTPSLLIQRLEKIVPWNRELGSLFLLFGAVSAAASYHLLAALFFFLSDSRISDDNRDVTLLSCTARREYQRGFFFRELLFGDFRWKASGGKQHEDGSRRRRKIPRAIYSLFVCSCVCVCLCSYWKWGREEIWAEMKRERRMMTEKGFYIRHIGRISSREIIPLVGRAN